MTLIALCAIALCWYMLSEVPDTSLQDEAKQYCSMVHAHKVDHSVGWPDFHHTYKKQCNADGTVNEAYVYGR